jgi:hypothetical protein
VLLVGGAYLLISGDDDGEFTQAQGEVFLEPANAVGPEPFTEDVETTEVDPDQIATASTTTTTGSTSTTAPPSTTTTPAPGVAAIPTQVGSTPGLYGGTQNSSRCDPQQLEAFLQANPDKAAAWVAALNSDPTLEWAGGNSLTVADVGAYIDELTPITLITDTRVTNYGYRNGQPTPRQAVLQAGTAVLVDKFGVPRAKCNCGNPLTTPTAVAGTVTYTGNRWPTFAPTTVVVIQETTVIIDVFVLVNIQTGGLFTRPAATTGTEDVTTVQGSIPPPTTPSTQPPGTAPPTTAPPSTAPPETVLTGDFCQAVQQYDQESFELGEGDEGFDEFLAWLTAAFRDLQRIGPEEVQGDIQMFLDASERGGESLFLEDNPELNAASDHFIQFVLTECGYDLDAND